MSLETAETSSAANRWMEMTAELRRDPPHPRSCYAVGLSNEFVAGRQVGKDFLGARVALYHDQSGMPVVLTARCPHMGVDLTLGEIVGNGLPRVGEPNSGR